VTKETETGRVGDSFGTKSLLVVLSMAAGSLDVIGFLGLGGLFMAHVTGNIVILAAKLGAGDQVPVAHLLSVPVFIVALALVRLLAAGLDRIRIAPLVPLLALQFMVFLAALAICIAAGSETDPHATSMVVASMFGISAMSVQNALLQISLRAAPSTAVMTTNVTRFVMDVGEILLGLSSAERTKAGERASRTGLTIASFFFGCILGAACEATLGLRSLVLPAGFALIALRLGLGATTGRGPRPQPDQS
jgi:uncharacterized membrane protein YoaK (UPF0700 family)